MPNIVYENWTVPVYALVLGELTDYIHAHRCIEVVTVYKGSAVLRLGSEMYELTPGCTAVVFPNLIHSYKVGENGIRCYYCTVSWGILSRFGDIFTSYIPDSPVIEKTPERLIKVFSDMTGMLLDKHQYNDRRQSGQAEYLLAELLPMLDLKRVKDVSGDNLERILLYYNENYAKKITLADIAADLHISTTYISSIFRRYFGTTPAKYLASIRIMEAERMLLDEKRNLTEIAMSSGFQSIRTFNRVFTAAKKMTPTEYRKKLLDEIKEYRNSKD
jgi:AraC-like DNA-binding protein